MNVENGAIGAGTVASRPSRRLVRAWSTGTLVGHRDAVLALALSEGGDYAVSAGRDGTLRRWHPASGRCLEILRGHTDAVTAVALYPDGRQALSGGVDGKLRLWDLMERRCLRIFPVKGQGPVTSVALIPGSDFAVSREANSLTRIWNLATGQCTRTIASWWDRVKERIVGQPDQATLARLVRDGWRDPMTLSRDGRLLLLGRADGPWVESYHVPGGKRLRKIRLLRRSEWNASTPGVRVLNVTPDGRHIVASGPAHRVQVWDYTTGECVRSLAGHTDQVSAIELSADSRNAVSAGWDRTVKVWDLATGVCLQTLHGHRDWVRAVRVAPDLRLVLSADLGGTIQCWGLQWAEGAGR
jgi:WD40 repeat protein